MEPGMHTGYQGVPGAYSEEALLSFAPEADAIPFRTLPDLFAALESGEVERAFVPVENSHAGSVVEAYDLMLDHPATVLAEWIHPVHHCLLALPGASIETIERVFSHPQALSQSAAFLREAGLPTEPFYDTAGAARMVAEQGVPGQAAVAGRRAAERYGLEILAENIETSPDNATRFFLLKQGAWEPGRTVKGEGTGKTSIIFAVAHQPGALVRALSSFSRQHVNLARLESRPSRRQSWEYLFFTDLEGYEDEPRVHSALAELRRLNQYVRILGSFPEAR